MYVEQISKRISVVVKESGLSKSAFAKRINVSQPHVSRMCNGETQPSDRTLSDICREFGVNEEWLRYGTGRKQSKVSRNEEIRSLMNASLRGPEEFREAVIQMIQSRSEADLEVLEKMLWDIVYNLQDTQNTRAENQPGQKVIKIAGRDGSLEERSLTDEDENEYLSSIDQLPDAGDDL